MVVCKSALIGTQVRILTDQNKLSYWLRSLFTVIYLYDDDDCFSLQTTGAQMLRVQVDIPKGYSSGKFLCDRFLFQRVIIPKSFIPKGHQDKNLRNDNPSG